MEQITVNLLATGETPVCHASQFDDGRTIRINLKKGADVYTLSGTEEVKMRIRKPDKTERVVDIVNTSNSYVDYVSVPEDCDISGVNVCELVIDDLGSKNFKMKVEEDAYGGGADIETLAASGPVATFETNLVDNLADLKAEITPIQDLHGYDYPWTAGGGKNLFAPYTERTSNNGINYSVNSNGTIRCQGTSTGASYSGSNLSYANAPILLKAGTYTISANGFSATGGAQGYLSFGARYSDETLVQSSSIRNNSATITLEEDAHCYYWIYVANNRTINEDIAIQVEAGSTATSWTPYENICPIEGWNEVKVARAGKNITNIAVLPYTIHWGTDAADLVQFLNTLPVGRYTISNKFKINEVPSSGKVLHGAFLIRALVNGEQINVTPYLLVTDNNPAVGKVYQESVSFEITEAIKGNINHAYRYCDQDNPHSGSGRGSYDCYDVQIETGSVATDYEPYAGTEVTVQFGQTVYKGVLDAKNSKVIATHAYATINPSTISKIGTWDGTKGAFWWTVSISGDWDNSSVNNGVSCDSFEMKPNISQVHTENGMCWNMQKIVRWLDVPTMSMTLEEYQTYVSTHPINCLYKLATPIEIPLSAISQLETLLGVNNVYANTGDVDLKYLKQV